MFVKCFSIKLITDSVRRQLGIQDLADGGPETVRCRVPASGQPGVGVPADTAASGEVQHSGRLQQGLLEICWYIALKNK